MVLAAELRPANHARRHQRRPPAARRPTLRPERGRDHARHDARRPDRRLWLYAEPDAESRSPRQRGNALRARRRAGAADAAGPFVALHRQVPAAARRPRQRRLLPRRARDDDGGALEGGGGRDRRLRRRLRPRPQVGHRAGVRPLLRRLRPVEIRDAVARRGGAAGQRGRRPRARVDGERQDVALLRAGSISTTPTRRTRRRPSIARALPTSRTSARSRSPTRRSAASARSSSRRGSSTRPSSS